METKLKNIIRWHKHIAMQMVIRKKHIEWYGNNWLDFNERDKRLKEYSSTFSYKINYKIMFVRAIFRAIFKGTLFKKVLQNI